MCYLPKYLLKLDFRKTSCTASRPGFFKGNMVPTVVNLSISTNAGNSLLSNALLRNSLWSFGNDDAPWHYRIFQLECRRSKYPHRSPIHVPPLQYTCKAINTFSLGMLSDLRLLPKPGNTLLLWAWNDALSLSLSH